MKSTQAKEEISQTLNEYANNGSYHKELKMSNSWLPRYFRRFHIVQELLKENLSESALVADIGGGEGVLVESLCEIGFSNALGVDPYAPLLHQNMKRGSILEIPLEKDSVDALTCLDVLEHIPLHLQDKACGELYRVLKPNGFAIISVPNMAHLRSRVGFLIKGKPWRNDLQKHPGELTIHERIQVLEKVGFHIADSIGIHLTISFNPFHRGILGRLLTRTIFSPYVPAQLGWTSMLVICKTNDSEMFDRFRRERTLRKHLKTYTPRKADPTFEAYR